MKDAALKLTRRLLPYWSRRRRVEKWGYDRRERGGGTGTDENGDKVHLKPGAEVKVTVEAESEATTPHDEKSPKASAA